MARKQATEEKQKSSARSSEKSRQAGEARRKQASRKREPAHKSAKSRNPVIRYFQETAEELRKVSWPTWEETVRLTVIVLGTTVVSAVFLGLLDLLFRELAALLV